MTEDKTVSVMNEGPKSKSLLMILAGLAVVIVVVLALYLGLQKATLNEEKSRLEGEIAALNDEIASLEGQKVEAAQLAQQWLDLLEEEEVRWSVVLSQVQSLIPFDATTNRNKIEFLSYSGTEDGRITMNAKTRALRVEPFPDVAELIEVFNDSTFFSSATVPSITRAEMNDGSKVASFVFYATYQDLGLEALTSGTDSTEEAQPGVSRQ